MSGVSRLNYTDYKGVYFTRIVQKKKLTMDHNFDCTNLSKTSTILYEQTMYYHHQMTMLPLYSQLLPYTEAIGLLSLCQICLSSVC